MRLLLVDDDAGFRQLLRTTFEDVQVDVDEAGSAAEAESRRLRHECEDFCDHKLASFEIVLERTQRMVQAGVVPMTCTIGAVLPVRVCIPGSFALLK